MEGYDEAQALTGEFEILQAGGYICEILGAEEVVSATGKQMLKISFDIAEGDSKDFYKRKYEEDKKVKGTDAKWKGVYNQQLEGEKAVGYFKGLVTVLEESNTGFKWNWNLEQLKGLKFGGLFGREEYVRQDNSTGFVTRLRFIRNADKIREGNFEIPKDKLIQTNSNDIFDSRRNTDDDLPF